MMIRVLSDLVDLGDKGCMLMTWKEDGDLDHTEGMILRDVKGTLHEVESISEQEGVYLLYLPKGDADYLGRLFRDIRIDGPSFEILGENTCQ